MAQGSKVFAALEDGVADEWIITFSIGVDPLTKLHALADRVAAQGNKEEPYQQLLHVFQHVMNGLVVQKVSDALFQTLEDEDDVLSVHQASLCDESAF